MNKSPFYLKSGDVNFILADERRRWNCKVLCIGAEKSARHEMGRKKDDKVVWIGDHDDKDVLSIPELKNRSNVLIYR